jgi:hypothetical protein
VALRLLPERETMSPHELVVKTRRESPWSFIWSNPVKAAHAMIDPHGESLRRFCGLSKSIGHPL